MRSTASRTSCWTSPVEHCRPTMFGSTSTAQPTISAQSAMRRSAFARPAPSRRPGSNPPEGLEPHRRIGVEYSLQVRRGGRARRRRARAQAGPKIARLQAQSLEQTRPVAAVGERGRRKPAGQQQEADRSEPDEPQVQHAGREERQQGSQRVAEAADQDVHDGFAFEDLVRRQRPVERFHGRPIQRVPEDMVAALQEYGRAERVRAQHAGGPDRERGRRDRQRQAGPHPPDHLRGQQELRSEGEQSRVHAERSKEGGELIRRAERLARDRAELKAGDRRHRRRDECERGDRAQVRRRPDEGGAAAKAGRRRRRTGLGDVVCRRRTPGAPDEQRTAHGQRRRSQQERGGAAMDRQGPGDRAARDPAQDGARADGTAEALRFPERQRVAHQHGRLRRSERPLRAQPEIHGAGQPRRLRRGQGRPEREVSEREAEWRDQQHAARRDPRRQPELQRQGDGDGHDRDEVGGHHLERREAAEEERVPRRFADDGAGGREEEMAEEQHAGRHVAPAASNPCRHGAPPEASEIACHQMGDHSDCSRSGSGRSNPTSFQERSPWRRK